MRKNKKKNPFLDYSKMRDSGELNIVVINNSNKVQKIDILNPSGDEEMILDTKDFYEKLKNYFSNPSELPIKIFIKNEEKYFGNIPEPRDTLKSFKDGIDKLHSIRLVIKNKSNFDNSVQDNRYIGIPFTLKIGEETTQFNSITFFSPYQFQTDIVVIPMSYIKGFENKRVEEGCLVFNEESSLFVKIRPNQILSFSLKLKK